MSDYLPRNELPPADRAASRPVASVSPAASAGQNFDSATRQAPARSRNAFARGADFDAASEDQLASAAEYARVHARVTDILASLRSRDVADASDTEAAITSLLPTPIVIVPLPPASRDMVEHAARVAHDIAEQASLARAAQAYVKHGTVDQILATAA